jgi:magnesium-transporting ATPase (P-type)
VPVERVLATLNVKPDQDLTSAEAQQRLGRYGSNAIVEKGQSLFAKIVGYLMGPIAYMIEAAALVSANRPLCEPHRPRTDRAMYKNAAILVVLVLLYSVAAGCLRGAPCT